MPLKLCSSMQNYCQPLSVVLCGDTYFRFILPRSILSLFCSWSSPWTILLWMTTVCLGIHADKISGNKLTHSGLHVCTQLHVAFRVIYTDRYFFLTVQYYRDFISKQNDLAALYLWHIGIVIVTCVGLSLYHRTTMMNCQPRCQRFKSLPEQEHF